ncbi:MAG TPA: hypothetical protein DDW52_14985 [Planctomycetaceae bacterium]|nr:hypothetical protein [Planctomycetaceae bacterium]
MTKPATEMLTADGDREMILVCRLDSWLDRKAIELLHRQVARVADEAHVPYILLLPGIDVDMVALDEIVMPQAGHYPKTVMLQEPRTDDVDSLGHAEKSWVDFQKCAARIWVRSSAETDFEPAEYPVSSVRLLLRLPPKQLAVGWGLKFDGTNYVIVDMEERGVDQLVSLEVNASFNPSPE